MIPDLIDIGAPLKTLPPGIHDATFPEIEKKFVTNPHRRKLFEGFRQATDALRRAGCSTVYLDGSFVTEKERPGDFDACWDDSGVNPSRLDKTLLDFGNKREAQKKKFMGELFPAGATAAPGSAFIKFFQRDRFTGRRKGILRIRLIESASSAGENHDNE
jgi:hypothetical protein